jgi:hypothetical protein
MVDYREILRLNSMGYPTFPQFIGLVGEELNYRPLKWAG